MHKLESHYYLQIRLIPFQYLLIELGKWNPVFVLFYVCIIVVINTRFHLKT